MNWTAFSGQVQLHVANGVVGIYLPWWGWLIAILLAMIVLGGGLRRRRAV